MKRLDYLAERVAKAKTAYERSCAAAEHASVTKEEARRSLSKEHRALGEYVDSRVGKAIDEGAPEGSTKDTCQKADECR